MCVGDKEYTETLGEQSLPRCLLCGSDDPKVKIIKPHPWKLEPCDGPFHEESKP